MRDRAAKENTESSLWEVNSPGPPLFPKNFAGFAVRFESECVDYEISIVRKKSFCERRASCFLFAPEAVEATSLHTAGSGAAWYNGKIDGVPLRSCFPPSPVGGAKTHAAFLMSREAPKNFSPDNKRKNFLDTLDIRKMTGQYFNIIIDLSQKIVYNKKKHPRKAEIR